MTNNVDFGRKSLLLVFAALGLFGSTIACAPKPAPVSSGSIDNGETPVTITVNANWAPGHISYRFLGDEIVQSSGSCFLIDDASLVEHLQWSSSRYYDSDTIVVRISGGDPDREKTISLAQISHSIARIRAAARKANIRKKIIIWIQSSSLEFEYLRKGLTVKSGKSSD